MATSRGRAGAAEAADPAFPALKALVIGRSGHHYYSDKDDLLFDRLRKRFKACGLADCTAYARHLAGPGGEGEWAALEAEITIGETFFFRYAEQFAALRTTILPGLIAARAAQRTLRVWSAGCATGAEPYSVAILIHELLGPALADWTVTIHGTDLNAAAIETARRGEYGPWALRTLPPPERVRWFLPLPPGPGVHREGGYRLRAEYRRMVRFERGNLLDLLRPAPPDAPAFDLVLCRNVLIYFSSEHVLGIVRGLARRLAPEAWLLLGHAEPNPAFAGWLTPVNLPGTVAYRPQTPALPVLPALTPPSPVPFVPFPFPSAFPPAVPPPPRSPRKAQPPPPSLPTEEVAARIRALADAGEASAAWNALREALAADPTDAVLRYYEGLLARDFGREAEAERALRGALFLDRDFVMAHYQLGLLQAARGQAAQAVRALDNARRLAQGLAPDAVLPEGDGVTAGELAGNARLALAALGTAP